MYKVASDKKQQALHHGRLADWTRTGPENLSLAQQRHNVLAAMKAIEEQIQRAPAAEAHELGLRKLELQAQARDLKVRLRAHNVTKRGIADLFMDVAKETLPKWQFDQLYRAAELKGARDREEADAILAKHRELEGTR